MKCQGKLISLQELGSAHQSVLLLADPLAANDAALAHAFQLEEDQRRRQGRSADAQRRALQAAEDERLARQLQVRSTKLEWCASIEKSTVTSAASHPSALSQMPVVI